MTNFMATPLALSTASGRGSHLQIDVAWRRHRSLTWPSTRAAPAKLNSVTKWRPAGSAHASHRTGDLHVSHQTGSHHYLPT